MENAMALFASGSHSLAHLQNWVDVSTNTHLKTDLHSHATPGLGPRLGRMKILICTISSPAQRGAPLRRVFGDSLST